MHHSNDEPLEILKWAGRLLYLALFISCMVVMGYWHLPFTFPFLGAVGALLYVGFIWKNKEEAEEEREVAETNLLEDDVHK